MRRFFVLVVLVFVLLSGFALGLGTLSTGSGNIYLYPAGGSVVPNVTNSINLGSSGNRWANVYTKRIGTNDGYLYFDLGLGGYLDSYLIVNGTRQSGILFYPGQNITRAIILTTFPPGIGPQGLNLYASVTGDQQFVPYTDNTYLLGTSALAWKNISSYGYYTKSSREYVIDFKQKYGKSAVDMLKAIEVDSDGKWLHETIPESYKVGEFWQVGKTTGKTEDGTEIIDTKVYDKYDDIPAEDRSIAEHHSLTSVDSRIDTCEAAIRELSDKIEQLQDEVRELKNKPDTPTTTTLATYTTLPPESDELSSTTKTGDVVV